MLHFDRKWFANFCGLGLTALMGSSGFSPAIAQSPFPATPLVPSGAVVQHDDKPGDAAVPINYPDKFAWKLFLEVNRKAAHQGPVGGKAGNPVSNDAVWETWADDPQTFPSNPDPAKKPTWPPSGEAEPRKAKSLNPPLRLRALQLRTAVENAESVAIGKLPPGGFSVPNGAGVGEEVHRNKVTFDYIVDNGLWYQEGIAAFFDKAAKAVGNDVDFASKVVNLPRASIEVKANWIVIDEKDKAKFHWNYNDSGQLLGLVAMHVISKDLPNWVWATFEHVDNPGRGDFIGIHDSFGADPAHVPSHTDKPGGKYPAEKITAALDKMFTEYDYKGEWLEQYKHYRLKGSQVDFTDSFGRPLLLGNSVTESGFVPTASCITCHSRAAVGALGKSSFPIFGEQAMLPLLDQDSLQPVLTYNGNPDPSWYFGEAGATTVLRSLQTDFIWAIPLRAKPAKPTPKP